MLGPCRGRPPAAISYARWQRLRPRSVSSGSSVRFDWPRTAARLLKRIPWSVAGDGASRGDAPRSLRRIGIYPRVRIPVQRFRWVVTSTGLPGPNGAFRIEEKKGRGRLFGGNGVGSCGWRGVRVGRAGRREHISVFRTPRLSVLCCAQAVTMRRGTSGRVPKPRRGHGWPENPCTIGEMALWDRPKECG